MSGPRSEPRPRVKERPKLQAASSGLQAHAFLDRACLLCCASRSRPAVLQNTHERCPRSGETHDVYLRFRGARLHVALAVVGWLPLYSLIVSASGPTGHAAEETFSGNVVSGRSWLCGYSPWFEELASRPRWPLRRPCRTCRSCAAPQRDGRLRTHLVRALPLLPSAPSVDVLSGIGHFVV